MSSLYQSNLNSQNLTNVSIDSEEKETAEYLNLKNINLKNKSAVKLGIYWYDGCYVSVYINPDKTQFKF